MFTRQEIRYAPVPPKDSAPIGSGTLNRGQSWKKMEKN